MKQAPLDIAGNRVGSFTSGVLGGFLDDYIYTAIKLGRQVARTALMNF